MIRIFKHRIYGPVIISVVSAAFITLLIGVLDVARRPDRWVEDALYQHPHALDGKILVIGIDDRALEEIGPYNTWDRNVMASALEHLGADSANRPAAVAIDTVYTGESENDADRRLADAAANLGNVITASFATLGTATATDENGRLYFDHNAVLDYSLPYEQLRKVTTQAHINAMTDEDGILRHAILKVSPDGEEVFSMAYTAAKKYADANGIAITEPPVSSGSYYVSFSSLPGGYYDGYSIYDLITGKLDPEIFAGKIVFIGPYAVGLQDTFFTAIDHGQQMYGVEYQANVTQMILDGAYKREVSDTLQAFILFIICAASFFVFWNADFKIANIAAATIIVLSLAVSYLFFNMGYVIHPLWVPIGVLALYLASIAIRYVRSAIEKQQLTRTFERYVAPEIVNEILAAGPENLSLGGKLCDIAVLFVD
ncbi:MAG: CHASE2 domain-containing protein, partial [Lachnospiraceae bacterium]|nr:CHASE2 domain-containing protein [Lachnospiraceae bacterium]